MDWRLFRLHYSGEPIELPRWWSNSHYHSFRHVSSPFPFDSRVEELILSLSLVSSQMYLLGYLPNHNRIYLCDKDVNLYAYSLSLSVIEYQTAILRGDLESASEILESVPPEQRNRLARFLETQELKELALEISTDPDHKFDLAIQLDDLETALRIARDSPHLGSQSKWRTVGDRALAGWKVQLAEECFKQANDLSALLLIYTSTGDRDGLARLRDLAGTLLFLLYSTSRIGAERR